MKDYQKLRRYYFAMSGVMDDINWRWKGTNRTFHNLMKHWYTVIDPLFLSTTTLDYDWRYNYVDFVHYLCAEHWGIYFDTDGYKYESIPFTFILNE